MCFSADIQWPLEGSWVTDVKVGHEPACGSESSIPHAQAVLKGLLPSEHIIWPTGWLLDRKIGAQSSWTPW